MTDYVRIVPQNQAEYAQGFISATSETTRFPVSNLLSNIRDREWRSTSQVDQTITGVPPIVGSPTASAWGVWPGTSGFLYSKYIRLLLYDGTDLNYNSGTDIFAPDPGPAFGTYLGTEFRQRMPHVEYFTPVSWNLFQVLITDGANGAYATESHYAARRLWIGEYVDAPYPADAASVTWRWVTTSKANRAFGTSLRRLVGGKVRAMRFETYLQEEADRATWARLLFYCEPGSEIILSLYQDQYRQHEDFTIMGSVMNASMSSVKGAWKVSIEIEES